MAEVQSTRTLCCWPHNRRINRVCVVLDAAMALVNAASTSRGDGAPSLQANTQAFFSCRCSCCSCSCSCSCCRPAVGSKSAEGSKSASSMSTAPVGVRPSPSEIVTTEPTCTVGTDAPAAEPAYAKALRFIHLGRVSPSVERVALSFWLRRLRRLRPITRIAPDSRRTQSLPSELHASKTPAHLPSGAPCSNRPAIPTSSSVSASGSGGPALGQ